jgi:hypothetical protein
MEIILQGGPHDQEQRRVEEHTRMVGVDGKWIYLPSGTTDSEGRAIFAYDEAASRRRQRES